MLRMLHRDRRERYTSAAQVQAALEHWTSDRPARVRLRMPIELQRGLVHLGLISEDDWKTAASAARRSSRATWRGEAPQTPLSTVQLPPEDAHPAIILQKLQELQNSRGGQKYGLSEFQVRMILNDNADLLRLPQHVLLDPIGAGWKGEIYRTQNMRATGRKPYICFRSMPCWGWAGRRQSDCDVSRPTWSHCARSNIRTWRASTAENSSSIGSTAPWRSSPPNTSSASLSKTTSPRGKATPGAGRP